MPIKRILFFSIAFVLLMTINNLAGSLYAIWQKQDLIVKAERDLDRVKDENQELKSKIAQVEQPQFVEEEARDKLLRTKPGEKIVVIPTGGIIQYDSPTPTPPDTRENWEKWWDTFFTNTSVQNEEIEQ